MKNPPPCPSPTKYNYSNTHRLELALADSVPVEDDAGGFEAGRLVELDEEFAHHRRQLVDYLLSVLLNTHSCGVSAGVGVHTANNLQNEVFYLTTHLGNLFMSPYTFVFLTPASAPRLV